MLKSLLRVITFLPLLLATGRVASAAPAVYQYGGTTSSAMSVNDGTSVGSIPAGTPFSGTFMFDVPQTATPVAFGGGTHSTYSFTETTLTVGTTTVRWGPGTIDVYDNLTSATSGYPIGDSLYININGVPPSGPINGAQFNWIFLGFVDGHGTAISGGALPSNLSLSAFQSAFIEFNYGTQGTPWGAGNTSTLQPLTSLSGSGGVPGISFAPTLPNGVVGTPYSATFAAASGGAGGFTYTAAGLPAGLTLAGTTVSGTPTAAGTSNVTLTATDSAGTSLAVTVTVTIADPAPVACSGKDAVVTAYVARNPGYIVVNGGLNLLDHLWTTNLTAANTTFLGGLVNWYQTGLIVSWTGTTDPNGCILTSLTVAPGVTITTSALPDGTVGAAYAAPVDVAWGVAPYKVNVTGLPSGLSFDGARISGTPRTAGSFPVTIGASDTVGGSASTSLTLVVAAPSITFAPTLPNGTVGVPYTATLSASGSGPFTYSQSGLPAGLKLSGDTISGTPTTAGSFAVTLTATDASGASSSAKVTLTIDPAPTSTTYTTPDEGAGKITEIGSGRTYLMVGKKKLIWDANTRIIVNTPTGERSVIDSFVKVGMKVQWKGLRDKATNTVLTSRLEVN